MNSFKRVTALGLFLLATNSNNVNAEVYAPFNMIYDSEPMLNMRSCLVTKLGIDYIESSVNAMINQYISRFNEKSKYTPEAMKKSKDVRLISNHMNFEQNGFHYTIARDSKVLTISKNNSYTVFRVAYTASSSEGMISSTDSFQGTIEVRIGPKYIDVFGKQSGESSVPQLEFSLGDSDEFAKKVLTFEEGKYFDQPAAAKYIMGIIRTFNQIAKDDAGAVYVDNNLNGLTYLMNCDANELSYALNDPVETDTLYMDAGKNIMNALWPGNIKMTF